MQTLTFTVNEAERLDIFLQQNLPGKLEKIAFNQKISNSKIRRLIIAGCVSVNKKIIKIPSYSLHKQSAVCVLLDEEKFFYEKSNGDIDFVLEEKDVLFEDENLIFVNKPAFLSTEETIVQGRKNLHQCVVEYLWKKNSSLRNPPYAGIMHRLDRETSGVILFTKNRSVNSFVHNLFETHGIQKTYYALCTKKSSANLSSVNANKKALSLGKKFELENYLGRISPKSARCKMGIVKESAGGQKAKTEFELVKEFTLDGKKYFLVKCKPFTGRTHQIRVHLSSLNLPILGDELYGGEKNLLDPSGRIMLHAASLEFTNPATMQSQTISAPLPEYFFF